MVNWKYKCLLSNGNLHVRLNFNLSKEKGIRHNEEEHNEISKIAKFGCEML
jgi:hypothetical protein